MRERGWGSIGLTHVRERAWINVAVRGQRSEVEGGLAAQARDARTYSKRCEACDKVSPIAEEQMARGC